MNDNYCEWLNLNFFKGSFFWLVSLIAVISAGIYLWRKYKLKTKLTQWLTSLIKVLLFYLKGWYQRLNSKNNNSKYEHLSPQLLKADNVYVEALVDGIDNPEVSNIALSGEYGSGKSSLIKTLQYYHPEYKYLNVSLASFTSTVKKTVDEKVEVNGEEKIISEEVDVPFTPDDNFIKGSILQQMFYHETGKKLPDSRFSRIRHLKKHHVAFKSIMMLIWLILGVVLYDNKILIQTNLDTGTVCDFFDSIWPGIFFLLGSGYILYKVYRHFNQYKLHKVNLKGGAEFTKELSESIFNKNLDELIYFFEATQFQVVVFEDLDRFENSLRVFSKLREINLLINNSKQISRQVVFVYAIKDSVFKGEEERTKFFDLIVPVIPVVSSFNAKTKFIEQLGNHGLYDDSLDSLIKNVSPFLNDMRLIINIVNELKVYSKSLKGRERKYLLAIIIYKNVYPVEYAETLSEQGGLYKLFNEIKQSKVEQILEKDKERFIEIEAELKGLEQESLRNEEELRRVFIHAIFSKVNNCISIEVSGRRFTLAESIEKENFVIISKNRVKIIKPVHLEGYENTSFEELGDELGGSYKNRKKQLLAKQVKKEIKLDDEKWEIEDRGLDIKQKTLVELLEVDGNVVDFSLELGKSPLLKTLVEKGYLNEEYQAYTSNFYVSENESENDFHFILKINPSIQIDYNQQVDNLEYVVSNLDKGKFQRNLIFHYEILEYLFNNKEVSEVEEKLNVVLSQIRDNVKGRGDEFFKSYLKFTKDKKRFVNAVLVNAPRLWAVLTQNDFEGEMELLFDVLSVITQENLKPIAVMVELDPLESVYPIAANILGMTSDVDFFKYTQTFDVEQVKMIIAEVGYHFYKINEKYISDDLLDYVYFNHYYSFTPENIELFVRRYSTNKKVDLKGLKTANYTTIKKSGCYQLEESISEDLGYYLENVSFKLESNIDESEEVLIEVLNNTEVKESLRSNFIVQQTVILRDIRKVEFKPLWGELFYYKRVEITWSNIVPYYLEVNEIDSDLLGVFNDIEFSEKLGSESLDSDLGFAEEELKGIVISLLYANDIGVIQYKNLLQSISSKWVGLNLEAVSKSHLEILIDVGILGIDVDQNQKIKNTSTELYLKFIEKNITGFIKNFSDFEIGIDEIHQIISFKSIITDQSQKLFELLNEEVAREGGVLNEEIQKNQIPFSTLEDLIGSELEEQVCVEILFYQEPNLKDSELKSLVIKLSNEWNLLFAQNGEKQTYISDEGFNQVLLDELEKRELISTYTPRKKGLQVFKRRL